jgi:gluconolactonase
MELVVFNDKVYDLVDPKAPLEKLSTGYVFTEGPVFHDGVYYFTDFQVNKIFRYENGKAALINDDSYFAIGMTYDRRKNRILRCTREKHAITDLEGNIIIDNYKGVRINGSNDVIVDTKGRIFFSDPLSRVIEGEQIGHSSVFMYDEDKGEMTMIESTLTRPNGLALSPDETILYIIDTDTYSVYKMNLAAGIPGPMEHFIRLDKSMGGGRPDGMRLDKEGNLYVTGPGGIWLVSPHGEALGLIKTPEIAANLCFDHKGIFITASTSIYRVDTKIPPAV